MGEIEFGKCDVCEKEAPLERTYFYYPIHCECCGCVDKNGQKLHFELVRHCNNCPAPVPSVINPLLKDMCEIKYRVIVSNITPCDIKGEFIIK